MPSSARKISARKLSAGVALASRSKPQLQLKRLYNTEKDAAEDEDRNVSDEEEEELEEDLGLRGGPKQKYPPLAHMSGLGASDQGLYPPPSLLFFVHIDRVGRASYEMPGCSAGKTHPNRRCSHDV